MKSQTLMKSTATIPAGDNEIAILKVEIILWIVNEVNRLERKVMKNGNYGLLHDIKEFYKTFFPVGKDETDCERIENCLHYFFSRFSKYYEGKKGSGKLTKVHSEYVNLFLKR